MTFTITPDNYLFLSKMPDIARQLNISSITVVPRYWVPSTAGQEYKELILKYFQTKCFSWKGFQCEQPDVDTNKLVDELHKYENQLGNIYNFPYIELSEKDFKEWFDQYFTQIGKPYCANVERLIDIQPDGNANFCVDFPDVAIGNVTESTIKEIWNGPKAQMFRELRWSRLLPVCYRCGAKHMAEVADKVKTLPGNNIRSSLLLETFSIYREMFLRFYFASFSSTVQFAVTIELPVHR